jgi:hypothetical protein
MIRARHFLLAIFVFTLLSSCKSLKSFPPDDHKTSSRWLEVGRGSFSNTWRCVITDKEFVEESYERANRGKQRGAHLLKDQTRLQLSSENARWFWQYVDRAKVLDWTDAQMPAEHHEPSLTYRQGSKKIELPVSKGCSARESSGFYKINDQIYELKQRAQTDVASNGPRAKR